VSSIHRRNECWQTLDEHGQILSDTELLFVANGPGAAALLPHLPLQGFAGQTSWLPASERSSQLRCTLVQGRYLTAAIDGRHLIGSTYDRSPLSAIIDPPGRDGHHRNMAALSNHFPQLEDLTKTEDLEGWNGLRCTTPDRLPLVGPLVGADEFVSRFGYLRHSETRHHQVEAVDPRGLHGLLALGSRAFTSAPLAAELAVSQAFGEPWPVPRSLALAVHPSRFMVRDLKRGKL
jgi:tRNA 5-methylaminomethyl-2-thiouridine biosynthesis bifunctional protein